MDYQFIVSQNLKILRIQHHLSFSELSKQTGLSKSTLQSLEQGGSHNLSTLCILANFYQIPLQALFEDKYMQRPDLLFGFLNSYDWFFRLPPEERLQFAASAQAHLDMLVQLSNMMQ